MDHKFEVGFLKVPADLDKRPKFLGATHKFVAPKHIDLRDYCTRTDSQGDRPWCAAYSACQLVENILWRRDDYPTNIDPAPVYKYAKAHDGDPHGDGTTLNAALEYFLVNNYFPKESEIQYIYGNDAEEKVKYSIHKFGCCHLGFQVDDSWFSLNKYKTAITLKDIGPTAGGHAVLGCGILPEGIIIQNSWGEEWSSSGFALVTWEVFRKEFLYGCVISHALDGFRMH